ncbi:glycosyltransferase family 4 protein [Tabrizicola sp.]|uniref:glycosyltransferase family 4 protein n=1 Tax=Tabrizicola sp. TaxID=2005166 RepID=UPI003F309CB8
MTKPRVLILAEQCNPLWPSLPIVGYKYALALAQHCDVRIATQVRNKPAITDDGRALDRFDFIDTEYIAAPMERFSTFLRGGNQVAWSTGMMMAYAPYIAFERDVWKRYRRAIEAGEYDLIHRITPMSPTLPSYIAGRGGLPFMIGPLNGNLDWPRAFLSEQKREKERLRGLRDLYKYLPYAKRTYTKAAAVLAAFRHTVADISWTPSERIVSFPEIGFDPEVFPAGRPRAPFAGDGPRTFLDAGRLVPYKVPEVVVRAFVGDDRFKPHRLRIIGDGPERPRIEAMVREAGAGDRVIFEGTRSQADVAAAMRDCDAFVFPSIRELGAGVVIEAMASGILCIVTDYGAPGDLVANGRGVAIPLRPLDDLVTSCRAAMLAAMDRPDEHAAMAKAGQDHALEHYTWDAKARRTVEIYQAVLSGKALTGLSPY